MNSTQSTVRPETASMIQRMSTIDLKDVSRRICLLPNVKIAIDAEITRRQSLMAKE